MLQSLTIERFRGIPSLTLRGLGRVNVFIGVNGAGKTTVLEAVNLMTNPGSPGPISAQAAWREMPAVNRESDDALRSVFLDLDVESIPEFRFATESGDHFLSIEPIQTEGVVSVSSTDIKSSSASYSTDAASLRGIRYMYDAPGGKSYTSELLLTDGGFTITENREVPRIGTFYIHARRSTSPGETARLLTRLYEEKREEQFISAMRAIDPRVQGFRPGLRGDRPVVLVDVGLPRLLPINVLGDGFCRVSLMMTGLLFTVGRTVIVDEIDSGLHNSVMAKFWKRACELSVSQDKQIFCTTHSDEMLSNTIEAFADTPDHLRIYRIDRRKNGSVNAKEYTYESYRLAEETGVDIR